jgi:hypothetical protein
VTAAGVERGQDESVRGEILAKETKRFVDLIVDAIDGFQMFGPLKKLRYKRVVLEQRRWLCSRNRKPLQGRAISACLLLFRNETNDFVTLK